MDNKYNIDDIIYEARVGNANKFAKEFYNASNSTSSDENHTKALAEILHDRKQILRCNLEVAKKYTK